MGEEGRQVAESLRSTRLWRLPDPSRGKGVDFVVVGSLAKFLVENASDSSVAKSPENYSFSDALGREFLGNYSSRCLGPRIPSGL